MKRCGSQTADVFFLVFAASILALAAPALAEEREPSSTLLAEAESATTTARFDMTGPQSRHSMRLMSLKSLAGFEPGSWLLSMNLQDESSDEEGESTVSDSSSPAVSDNGDSPEQEVLLFASIPRVKRVRQELPNYWYCALTSGVAGIFSKAVGLGAGFAPGSIALLFFLNGGGFGGPAAFAALSIGMLVMGLVIDSAISALASGLVFDLASTYYDSNYVAGFAGHLAGNVFSLGVPALVVGFGAMLATGTTVLADFAVAGAAESILGFSLLLGVPPAVAISALSWVLVPSLIGAWAMVNNATPADGYVLDPDWKPLRTEILPQPVPAVTDLQSRESSYFSFGMVFPGS